MNSQRKTTGKFQVGEAIEMRLQLESDISVLGEVGYTIKTMEGVSLFTSSSNDNGQLLEIKPGSFELHTRMEPNYLRPGQYLVQVGTTCLTCRDLLSEAISFEVVADRHYSDGGLYNLPGSFHFPYFWETFESAASYAN